MQLVAYGAQDVYLTGNPQITFFKVVYRRHTNFAMESIEQTFNGNGTALGSRVSCTVSRNGDLIHKMFLRVEVPAATLTAAGDEFEWANKLGLALIKNVELEIGGQRIDKHYGDWMNIWNELSLPESKKAGYAELVGAQGSTSAVINANVGTSVAHGSTAVATAAGTANASAAVVLNVPLEFWFCRNPGLALPLIALQYHEVKVNVEYNSAEWVNHAVVGGTSVVVNGTTRSTTGAVGLSFASAPALWVDYIYLDTDERRRFAQTSHEYLIEQLQFTGEESVAAGAANASVRLNFNHPVKELVWVAQPSVNVADSAARVESQFWYDLHTDGATEQAVGTGLRVNPVAEATLKLNGHDRMATRSGDYYNSVQPFQHHTRVPSDKGINVYSFALKPEEHQPSGTCNMSRIDVAQLQMSFVAHATSSLGVRVYATNYNVLRIMSGMGGLAYAN